MALASCGVPCDEVNASAWKAEVSSHDADKTAVLSAIESRFGTKFPSHLPVDGKNLKFKHDASDAVGIGIWGVRQQHPSLIYTGSVTIRAPSLGESRPLKDRASARETLIASAPRMPLQ